MLILGLFTELALGPWAASANSRDAVRTLSALWQSGGMARDEEKDMQYIVTSNLPGYLPDEDPGEPMDFETAKMALKDELQHSYNSLGEPEEEAETLAGILVMVDDLTEFACEGGLNIHFGDWVHSLTAVES